MKKIYIFIILLLLLIIACFIPVSQQKSILIKSSFLNVFDQLQNAENWKKWRPDLRKAAIADSDKIETKTFPGSFIINYKDLALDVKLVEGSFKVSERNDTEDINYDMTVLPGKTSVNSLVAVKKWTSFIKYLADGLKDSILKSTHVTDLKSFMETDSLFYGFNISKTRVPGDNLIEMRKAVLKKDKFVEAAKMKADLQQYMKTNNLKQIQPLIAQFLQLSKDSDQVNVGFFIDKEIKPYKEIQFVRMPKGGPLYITKFNGKFNKRQKVYTALHQYFTDHSYQRAILPFETYLDDKLPTTDTDKVNIIVNFTSYF